MSRDCRVAHAEAIFDSNRLTYSAIRDSYCDKAIIVEMSKTWEVNELTSAAETEIPHSPAHVMALAISDRHQR